MNVKILSSYSAAYIPQTNWGLKICLGNMCFRDYVSGWIGRCRGALRSII